MTVVGIIAGIGFTVALFFATAAFPYGRLLDETKIGALLSFLALLIGLLAAKMLKSGAVQLTSVIGQTTRRRRSAGGRRRLGTTSAAIRAKTTVSLG